MTELEQIVEASRRLRPNSQRAYLGSVRAFQDFVGRAPARWTGAAVEAFRDSLEKAGATPSTINGHLAALRYVSKRYSERHGNDPRLNFAPYAERVRTGRATNPRKPLTLEEGRRLMAYVRNLAPAPALRNVALLTLGQRTGLRMCSLIGSPGDRRTSPGLRLEDYDRRTGRMQVTLKGGSRYTLPPIDEVAAEALHRWVEWLRSHGVREGAIFRRLYQEDLRGHVRIGDALTPSGISDVMSTYAAAAKVRFHFHRLRHGFVTELRRHGVEDRLIAAYTGHALERGGHSMLDTYTDAAQLAAEKMPTRLLPRW